MHMKFSHKWKYGLSMSQFAPSEIPHKFTVSYSIDAVHELEASLRFDDAGNPVGDASATKFVTVRPGFHMLAARTDPRYIPAYTFELQDMPLAFSFCLSGSQEINFNRGTGKRGTTFRNERGVNSLMRLGRSAGFGRYLSGDPLHAVAILLHREVLEEYLAQELGEIPEDCRSLFRRQGVPVSLPMTSKMYQMVAEPFAHRYEGAAARLHLESCALELLALQIDRLVHNTFSTEKKLNRFDEDRIRAVADLLIKSMAAPPAFSTLARQVGVNEAKLRRGFKQVFGVPPLQFLMRQRMACARELLLGQHLDVSQAASYVGYTNISHFIICYKKIFGVTPGCHKRGCPQC